jgi:ATP/maltotriose-dependent transcriptional regulator MalT
MTMTFSQHDSIDPNGAFDLADAALIQGSRTQKSEPFHLFRQKITRPAADGAIERPRVMHILDRSLQQFPATLVLGRAGMGKTALAAALAAKGQKTSWYSIDSTDTDWPVFARYFTAAILGTDAAEDDISLDGRGTQTDIARFLVRLFSRFDVLSGGESSLIVLDDIHCLFDAPWFDDFFDLLLYSLPPSAHVVLLSRSKPPKPLWRLRSKQLLNVLDEKTIAFDLEETEKLLRSRGTSVRGARRAVGSSFGRVSKLLELCAR